jgi:DNA-binding NarL/FixJ family response regulator
MVVAGRRRTRFSLRDDREVIAMAKKGKSASTIAAKLKTTVKTIERKAKTLGLSIRVGRSRSG